MNNGKLTDVVIEDVFYTDPQTGLRSWANFEVWMDESARKAVERIPGVSAVYKGSLLGKYTIYIDKRYDHEYLKREIEAQAKIHAED